MDGSIVGGEERREENGCWGESVVNESSGESERSMCTQDALIECRMTLARDVTPKFPRLRFFPFVVLREIGFVRQRTIG